jgi:hypothetical protein
VRHHRSNVASADFVVHRMDGRQGGRSMVVENVIAKSFNARRYCGPIQRAEAASKIHLLFQWLSRIGTEFVIPTMR